MVDTRFHSGSVLIWILGLVLTVGMLGVSVVFIGNPNSVNADKSVPLIAANGNFLHGRLVNRNPSRLVDYVPIGIGKVTVENLSKHKQIAFIGELSGLIFPCMFENRVVKDVSPRRPTRNDDVILQHPNTSVRRLRRKMREIFYPSAPDSSFHYLGRILPFISEVNSEYRVRTSGRLDDHNQPRALRIDNGLRVEKSGASRFARFVALPNDSSKRENYRQCLNSVGPPDEFIEPLHFFLAAGSLLFGLGLIGGRIWGDWRPGRWFGWAFLVMAWILLMSGRQYSQPEHQNYHEQGFTHGAIVPQKPLDTI